MPERVFLGWDQPLLRLLTGWLLARGGDLSRLLVVVPTAQAGRLLRQSLAEAGGALLAPRVVTPEHFFRPGDSSAVASRVEARFAWIDVLRGMPAGSAPALFPVEPVDRSFAWAAGVAQEIEKVRNVLAEGGKSFVEARAFSPEKDRWGDLIEVERRVLGRFEKWRVVDPLAAKLQAADSFGLPGDCAGVVIAGVPDPVPLALAVWKRLDAAKVPVTVLVHAPEEEVEMFDEWGRPSEDWGKRPTPVPRARVHLVSGPPELAAKAVSCFAGTPSDQATVGLCDPAFGPALERLESRGKGRRQRDAADAAGFRGFGSAGRAMGTGGPDSAESADCRDPREEVAACGVADA
jgi:hypothetical protein